LFFSVLENSGLTIIDARAEEKRLLEEKKEKALLEKKKNPCPHCSIKYTILDTDYCPFGNPEEKNPNCKYFWEKYSDSSAPKEVSQFCFICKKEFEHGELIRELEDWIRIVNVHNHCYYELLKKPEELELLPCDGCKKRGNCRIQQSLFNIIENNSKIWLSLNRCNYFKAENEEDFYVLKHTDYSLNLYTEFGELIERDLVDIVDYVRRKQIKLENISCTDDIESEAALEELKKRLAQEEEKEE